MMPESHNFGIKEMLQRYPVVWSSLLKHISVAMNMHKTIEEILRTVIINQSAPKL
jgi:hypothetical protein